MGETMKMLALTTPQQWEAYAVQCRERMLAYALKRIAEEKRYAGDGKRNGTQKQKTSEAA